MKTRRASRTWPPIMWAALAWLICAGLGAGAAPWLLPAGPFVTDAAHSLAAPNREHLLGTDLLGRDVLTRLVWGGRWTLGMGAVALAVTVGLGLPIGLVAGVFGGRIDAVLMRVVDALLAFPGLLMAMAAAAVLERSAFSAALAIGLAASPAYARVTRAATLEVRAQPYIEAARAVGCGPWRIVTRYILPNAAAPLLAFGAAQLGWVLLNGAALNFLGLGVRPGVPEWGAMIAESRGYLRDSPWASLFPGLALTLTILAVNILADGMQEMRSRCS